MGSFETVVKVLANAFSVLTALSPAPSLLKAHRAKDVGELSVLPLVGMFLNAFPWLTYGWLAGDYFPIVTTYAVGTICSIAYVSVYFSMTPHRAYVVKVVLCVAAGTAIFVLYVVLGLVGVTGQSRDGVTTVVGFIADVGAVILYASPFETIVHVVRVKNASSLPIHLCLVGAVCNSLWFVYGLLQNDWIITAPNLICAVVGWIQVAVYVVYRPSKAQELAKAGASATDSDAHELEGAYVKVVASPTPEKAAELV